VLVELNVEPGQQVDVGAVLARVDDPHREEQNDQGDSQ
jgi:multidrug efflux pump subunit AcrA (membrane-fusion protein)